MNTMRKFWASVIKESLVLLRDKAGLALLFIMPMALIFIMAMLQDSSFKTLTGEPIPVLFLNEDKDSLGSYIERGLSQSHYFKIVKEIDGKRITSTQIQQEINRGNFKMGVVVPVNATKSLKNSVKHFVNSQLEIFGFDSMPVLAKQDSVVIEIYFDPVIIPSFKASLLSAIEKYFSKIETQYVSKMFMAGLSGKMPVIAVNDIEPKEILFIQEKTSDYKFSKGMPNAVQHNVTAYIIFAIFFIVVPLAGNLIHERESGCISKLRTMPVSYVTVILGKVSTYLVICFIQFILMVLVGIYLLPLCGLSSFELGTNYTAIILVVFSAALAATGFGVAIGTFASTAQQGSIFGSVSVVILAAIGGIWVPTYVMPEIMKIISNISPLNWGLNALYNIFVRHQNIGFVVFDSMKLVSFSGVCILLAYFYHRSKTQI